MAANHLLDQQIPWAGTCAAEVLCGPPSDPAIRPLQTSGGPDECWCRRHSGRWLPQPHPSIRTLVVAWPESCCRFCHAIELNSEARRVRWNGQILHQCAGKYKPTLSMHQFASLYFPAQ